MRILHVVKDLGLNGAARVVRTLADAQSERGHNVALMAASGPLGSDFDGPAYDLPATGRDPRMLIPAVRRLRATIADFRPDVVHAHNPGIMLLAGIATRRGKTVRALTTLHGSAPEQYRLNARAARLAGLPLIACGPTVAEQMRAAGRAVEATIVNGVRVQVHTDRLATRRALGVTADQSLIVQVGRLAAQKDPVLAVRGFAAGAPSDARLVFAGEGPERAAIERAVGDLGVQDRVTLLGDRDDAHDLMLAADVVTLTSSWEGHPLVLLEAMSLGRPVVATRAPGSRELLRDGVDGLLTDPSPESLGAALGRVCGSTELAQRLSANALARRFEFSQDAMTDAYLEAYRRVCPSR